MPFQFTLYLPISVLAVMILTWLAIALWRRRPAVGVIPMVVMLGGVILWTLSNAAEISVTDLAVKKVLAAFIYFGITIVSPGWLTFVLEYTGREYWLTRRNVLLLTVQPVLVQIAIWTNGLHHLFWIERTLDTSGQYAMIDVTLGPLFWIHAVYSYGLLLIGSILLIGAFIRSPQVYRGQMFWMLVAAFAPWGANFLYLSGLSPLPDYIDPTPLAFTVTVLAMSWSVFHHQLTDLVPVARDIVVEGIGDAVIVLDRANRIIDANPAALKMIGLPLKGAAGQLVESFLIDQPELVEKYRGIEQVQAEVDLRLNDGTMRTFTMNLSPLRNRRETLVGRVIVLHDITELKQANRELKIAREKAEESNRLKTQFLTTMSHELRTPLHAIHGYTELILIGVTGEINDSQRQNLDRVMVNADNLRQMIDDLLDLSKIEAGRIEISRQPFEVKTWFDGLLQQNRPLVDEKGLTFIADLDDELPDMLLGDAVRLRQIAANLIANAVKFTEAGEVRVTIKRVGSDLWQIVVADTGIGIPREAQEYIFDRFRQADGSPTRKYGGTGLGLSIVRDLAMMMGGGVRVNSEVGKGSTFSVTLPLIIPETRDALGDSI